MHMNGQFRKQEELAEHTTWRIGGPAETFVLPRTLSDLQRVVSYAKVQEAPLFVLGRGSNVLIDDAGLPGFTIYMASSFQNISVTNTTVTAGAGVPLPKLAMTVAKHGYSGFEFLIGIPGTVGGGVLINAGAGGAQIADILESITILDQDAELRKLHASELQLSYRYSNLLTSPVIVVEAVFRLGPRASFDSGSEIMRRIIRERRARFPLQHPNAGSVFKRPAGEDAPPPGWLIETSGLKGLRVGDAQVSPVHANFICNLGNATAVDVRTLVEIIQERVQDVHSVVLEREVIFWPQECRWRNWQHDKLAD